MQELRQSTEIKVRIGPAVDATDGVTPETTLALGTADQAEALKHNGAATVDISSNTFAAITGCDGWYDLTLTTSDTNTLGLLDVVIQDSSLMVPIHVRFMVVTSNYWDSKYSTDALQVDVVQISGDSTAADNCEAMFDGTGYAGGSTKLQVDTVSISGDSTAADNCEAMFDGTGYAGGTTKLQVDAVAISGDTTAADNAELAFDGTGYGFTNCIMPTVTTLTGHTPQTGDTYAALPSNFSDLSITATTGRVDVASIEGSDATNQIRDAIVDDATRIDASALNTLSSHAPDNTIADVDNISGLNDPTAAAIADAVWDEASTGHVDAGKAGAQLWTDIDSILTQIGTDGDGLTAIPWNSSWDAEVQSEVADALNAAVPGSPTADSINERIKTFDDNYTSIRAGYLDELAAANMPADIDAVKAITDVLQLEATTNYIKSVPQDLEDVSIGDGDTLGSGKAGEALRWLRWFIKNTWDVDTTPDPDEMNIYKDNGTTKGYCFQVYTSSNHNYRKVVACS